MSATGILAALAAPFVMTLGFVLWDNHWTGSAFALNLYKCTLASVGFLIASVSTRDEGPFPSDIFTTRSVGFLMLSSTLGILIGDITWLEALRRIGARRVIVVDSIKPFVAALLGWAILDEDLPGAAFGGMALTVVGVLWVSLEKEQSTSAEEKETKTADDDDIEGEDVTEDVAEKDAVEDEELDVTGATERTEEVSVVCEDDEDAATIQGSVAQENSSESAVSDCHDDASAASETAVNQAEQQQLPNNEENTPHPAPAKSDNRPTKKTSTTRSTRDLRIGYTLSILNVILDTYGSLLTKEHGVDMTTWEINLIRFGFAGAFCLSLSFVMHLRDYWWYVARRKDDGTAEEKLDRGMDDGVCVEEGGENAESSAACDKNTETDVESTEIRPWYALPTLTRQSWFKISAGVLFVTFLCPALSNYALFQIALALALTLGSVGPLYALPLTWLLQKDKPTWRSGLGACIAVAGIAVLSFFGTED